MTNRRDRPDAVLTRSPIAPRSSRLAILALAACAALAVPASAGAATLKPDKTCVGNGDLLVLNGAGYTPNANVQLSANGTPLSLAGGQPLISSQVGTFAAGVNFPFEKAKRATDSFTATETSNPAITASATVKHVDPKVRIRPRTGPAFANRHFRASGFTGGSTMYGHRRRAGKVANFRVGKLTGACASVRTRGPLLPPHAKAGVYRIQFDTFRKYSASRRQKALFRVKVRVRRARGAASAASAASASEIWTRIP